MRAAFDEQLKQKLYQRLSGILQPEQILVNENMSAHTTFRVGGGADIFVEINQEDALEKVLGVLRAEGLTRLNEDFYLLGNGSNVLVSDQGIRGVVLHLTKTYGRIQVEGTKLVCEAGATLAAIAHKAYENSLTGFEFASGIPGSLGGAIVMNAGAYGGEMRQVVQRVRLMTLTGEVVEKDAEGMHFGYRHSLIKEEPLIVTKVTLALARGSKQAIREKMEELAARRREKQPLEYPSAGSTFKRPKGSYASLLIEQCGLKGFTVGGAQVSEKHSGFVINKGGATCSDVLQLCEEVKRVVLEKSGYILELEPIILK